MTSRSSNLVIDSLMSCMGAKNSHRTRCAERADAPSRDAGADGLHGARHPPPQQNGAPPRVIAEWAPSAFPPARVVWLPGERTKKPRAVRAHALSWQFGRRRRAASTG